MYDNLIIQIKQLFYEKIYLNVNYICNIHVLNVPPQKYKNGIHVLKYLPKAPQCKKAESDFFLVLFSSIGKCLFLSGFTEELLNHMHDTTLPGKYKMGFTNMVARATPGSKDLSR